jgi:hypothetical protein
MEAVAAPGAAEPQAFDALDRIQLRLGADRRLVEDRMVVIPVADHEFSGSGSTCGLSETITGVATGSGCNWLIR